MIIKGVKYEFTAEPWQYASPGGWFFVTLPTEISAEIREIFRSEEEGWGRLKATAKIGNSEWKTAIWFDRKMSSYLIPLKAEIRKKENLVAGKAIKINAWI
ncbi:MAG TPA: DUF1905 domain-containing protein [Draconibacterium sp.]|nr:DUF1905 domain-containing protein [Draconibacterium sp.]